MTSVTAAGPDPAFESEGKAFLEEAANEFSDTPASPSARYRLFPDLTAEEEDEELRLARAWRARRFDAGFGWITGPVEYGGRGLSSAHAATYHSLERAYRFPTQRMFDVGIAMVAPMLERYGSDEARATYLRSLHRGDVVGCQLFSEPSAGSDLSRIDTTAVPEGTGWRVRGQKIWSSNAHVSDVGILAVRTGPSEARHRNLTVFLLPMRSPGVTVRPIRQMTGGASFNEVFIDDVQVPGHLRLGEVDGGWEVVIATLMHERAAVGAPGAGGAGILSIQQLILFLRSVGALDQPAVRAELIRLHCSLTVARWTRQRLGSGDRGVPPGPVMSIGKLALNANLAAITRILGLALGPSLIAETDPDIYAWARFVLGVPGLRIAGGSDEIQRNILAERVLGLPR